MEFEELKQLWHKQASPVPDREAVYRAAHRYRRAETLKTIGMMLLMIATLIGMALIRRTFEPRLFTTKLGLGLLMGTIGLYVFAYIEGLFFLRRIDPASNNHEHLAAWQAFYRYQVRRQTVYLSLYFLLMGFGFALNMYEYTRNSSWIWQVACYGSTFGWMAVTWFLLRPKRIKKERAELDKILRAYEALRRQLEEDRVIE